MSGGPFVDQLCTSPVSDDVPLARGPRNWGQSSAKVFPDTAHQINAMAADCAVDLLQKGNSRTDRITGAGIFFVCTGNAQTRRRAVVRQSKSSGPPCPWLRAGRE